MKKNDEGWIVLDDYQDPIKATYIRYKNKESAFEEAKFRLKSILDKEKLDGYDDFLEKLVVEGSVLIGNLNSGWSDDSVLIRIVQLCKEN